MSAAVVMAFVAASSACSSGELGASDQGHSSGGASVGANGGAPASTGGAGGQAGGGHAGETSAAGTSGGAGAAGTGGATGTGASSNTGTGGPGGCRGGGSAGSSATVGGAGVSGAAACCYAPPSCLEGLCGNGVRDACTASSGPGSCPPYSFSEQCDGHDLHGETCVSIGHGSGTLACSDACFFDMTGCYTCAANSPAVARCNAVPSRPWISFRWPRRTPKRASPGWINPMVVPRRSGSPCCRRAWTSFPAGASSTRRSPPLLRPDCRPRRSPRCHRVGWCWRPPAIR